MSRATEAQLRVLRALADAHDLVPGKGLWLSDLPVLGAARSLQGAKVTVASLRRHRWVSRSPLDGAYRVTHAGLAVLVECGGQS